MEVIFGGFRRNLEALGCLWTHFGQFEGPWAPIGCQLECLGGFLGGSWAHIGAGWGHLRVPLAIKRSSKDSLHEDLFDRIYKPKGTNSGTNHINSWNAA